jgi:hypothetical protein
MQAMFKLTDAGGRLIAEGLKGNCSVTEVHLVSFEVLFVCLVLLTCAGQGYNLAGDAVHPMVHAITKRNQNEPEQRLAEVAAIKEVCVVCKCA